MPNTRYLMIDSKNRKKHENGSRLNITLSEPIVAKSVKLVSFTAVNEIFNVRYPNNKLKILTYRILDSASILASPTTYPHIESTIIEIPDGLYSMVELTEKITQMSLDAPTGTIDIEASVLSNHKIQFSISSSGTQKRRMVLWEEIGPKFYQSLAYKLGFHRNQILELNDYIVSDKALLISHFSIFRNAEDGTDEVTITYLNNTFTELQWNEQRSNGCLIWNHNAIRTNVSHNIGYESPCANLYILTNLITDFERTINVDDQVLTTQASILQKIAVNANIYSYIHQSNLESFSHSVNRTIQNFWIELVDDDFQPFTDEQYKNYNLVLQFETQDNEQTHRINEKILLNNQELGFRARHGC